MESSKYLALIGAILGILSYVLSLVLPEIFCWYRIVIDDAGDITGYVLNGFGVFTALDPDSSPIPPGTEDTVILGLIGGILVLVGAVACVGGTFRERRNIAIIGGVLMVLGPFLIVLDMIIGLSDYSELVEFISGKEGFALFFGTTSPGAGINISWGLWIGSFLAFGGAIAGLIAATSI